MRYKFKPFLSTNFIKVEVISHWLGDQAGGGGRGGGFLVLQKEASTSPLPTLFITKKVSSFCKLLYYLIIIERETVILSIQRYFSILPCEGFPIIRRVLPRKQFCPLLYFPFITIFSNYSYRNQFITVYQSQVQNSKWLLVWLVYVQESSVKKAIRA